MEIDAQDLIKLASEKLELGQNLKAKLSQFEAIEGVPKTIRKINQEIKFLQKVSNRLSLDRFSKILRIRICPVWFQVISNGTLKLSHVTCSNLTHFEFLVKVLEQQKDVLEVDAAVNSDERETPLRVDIICDGGRKWIKGWIQIILIFCINILEGIF